MRGPLIVLLCVVGCGDSVDSMPPPLTTGPSSTTLPVDDTTGDTSSTTEVEQCPWDGTCSSLVPNAELCGALWALECGDG